MNSTWLITSELANQCAWKVLFTCVVYTNAVYYMASSVSGQDEPNPELWLATEVGKMVLSWLLLITRCVPQENTVLFPSKRSFIDLFGQDGWVLASFFFCEFMDFNSIVNTPKKDSANIQPSWPHAWSITHISLFLSRGQLTKYSLRTWNKTRSRKTNMELKLIVFHPSSPT